jgi:hypothetical protein
LQTNIGEMQMVAQVRNLTLIDEPAGESAQEALLSQLTDAAYRVALRHGIKGSFIDFQLELWQKLREVLAAKAAEGDRWQR